MGNVLDVGCLYGGRAIVKKRDKREKKVLEKKEEKKEADRDDIHRCQHGGTVMHKCLFMTLREGFITMCDCCVRCENTCSEVE